MTAQAENERIARALGWRYAECTLHPQDWVTPEGTIADLPDYASRAEYPVLLEELIRRRHPVWYSEKLQQFEVGLLGSSFSAPTLGEAVRAAFLATLEGEGR